MAVLEITCLGPLSVTLDGRAITSFGTDKVRALLVYLAMEAERPHRREHLAGLLWSDQSERKALHSLRQSLHTLRKALRDDRQTHQFILIENDTLQFNPASAYWLDARAFQQHLESALGSERSGLPHWRVNIRRLLQATELYRGHFLDQFYLNDVVLFDEWSLLQRETFSLKALRAYGMLLEYHEKRGDLVMATRTANRLVELAPWDEAAHRELMRLLALQGQHAAALAQFQHCRRILADDLGVEPARETQRLFEAVYDSRAEQTPLKLRYPSAPHNLPNIPTPFVGRQAELDDLAAWLADPYCRLLTIHGPGGIGKTRLALEAASEQIGLFSDGVFFVPLVSLRDAEQVLPAMAEALGFAFSEWDEPKAQFLNRIRSLQLLLVLDNFEHLSLATGLLAEILAAAVQVYLLVTSRQRLNLHAERLYTLEGLAYPAPGEAIEPEIHSAVALFLERAQRAQRDFEPTADQQREIIEICRLLDGLPLGVELAATAVWSSTPAEIAAELCANLDTLTSTYPNIPARHRSLRAAFEHSWRLLSTAEQELFARLAVFHGGFERQAGSNVTGADPAMLAALQDKSLLRRSRSGRYDLHELIRQFAIEKLAAAPQALATTQARHARYYATYLGVEGNYPAWEDQKIALARTGQEIENARQAWYWALHHGETEIAVQCLDSLYMFFNQRCRFQEGIDLLSSAVSPQPGGALPASLQAKILARQGALLMHITRYEQAHTALEDGLAMLSGMAEPGEQVFILVQLATLAQRQGQHQRVEQIVARCLELARQTGDRWGIASSLYLSGLAAYRTGDVPRAKSLLEASLASGEACGNPRLRMAQLYTLGDIACHQGEYPRARQLFEESLSLSRQLGDLYNAALHLNNLGTIWHVQEQYEQAQSCYQQSLALYTQIGDRRGQAIALSNLGEIAHISGDYQSAASLFEQGLALARQINDQWSIMACLNNLGEAACAQGDCCLARKYLAEVTTLAHQTQSLTVLMKVLVNLGEYFVQQGQMARAAQLLHLAQNHPASELDNRRKAARLAARYNLPAGELPAMPLEDLLPAIEAELQNSDEDHPCV